MGLFCTRTEILLCMDKVSTKDDVEVLLRDIYPVTERKVKLNLILLFRRVSQMRGMT